MKAYRIKIESHYVASETERFIADSEISAIAKARDYFGFAGSKKHIKVQRCKN